MASNSLDKESWDHTGVHNFTNTVTLPQQPQSRYGIFYERDGLFSPSPNWIRVSDFDNVLEVEPNNDRNKATKTEQTLPLAFNGIIEKNGDSDWFRFEARKGQSFAVRVQTPPTRSNTYAAPVDTSSASAPMIAESPSIETPIPNCSRCSMPSATENFWVNAQPPARFSNA